MSGLEEAPSRTKLRLELSRATKLGLDGGPIGLTLGLELLELACSRIEAWREDGFDRTVLIVGAAAGNVFGSSSEYAAIDSWSEP